MSATIVAEGLSKRYRIGEYKAGYETLRDTLAHTARRALRLEHVDHSLEEIWALKDVSFEVEQGQVVGFIGRNGAGKSTLLKLLTQITPPTEGTATIRGRVGSILEVGTGFHPELTGRENTYLNGAILGMKRREIRAKFDEIVEFSGIGKFIDTPVKRYSSGMYVRLAFAVAAHLEQEILLVDEVLAVGDAAFQKKCLGKMSEVASNGRTIVLVSHNLVAIEQLCTNAIWMDGGLIVEQGPASEVVEHYNASFAADATGEFDPSTDRGDGTVVLESYEVTNERGAVVPLPITGEDVILSVRMRVRERISRPAAGITITTANGVRLVTVDTSQMGQVFEPWEPGERTVTVRLRDVPFLPGTHRVDFWVMAPGGHLYAHAPDTISFEIGQSPLYGTSYVNREFGSVYTAVDVSTEAVTMGAGDAIAPVTN